MKKMLALVVMCCALSLFAGAEEQIDIDGKFTRIKGNIPVGWAPLNKSDSTFELIREANGANAIRLTVEKEWNYLYSPKENKVSLEDTGVLTVTAKGKGKLIFGGIWYDQSGKWLGIDSASAELSEKAEVFTHTIKMGIRKLKGADAFRCFVGGSKKGDEITVLSVELKIRRGEKSE